MMSKRLEYSEDLIKKADNLLSKSEEELKGYAQSYSNIIANCQTAIELSAKSIFKTMGMDFPKEHQLLFKRKKGKVMEEVRELLSKQFPEYFTQKHELPRILFLTYFWHEFYTIAKYGISELDMPPDKLFEKEDAELAISHAKYCVNIANTLLMYKENEEKRR
ncbi:MAG: HEPN domain-containing protein [Methanobacteriaceae archaeon]|jgi:HEPN domain-containing protein